MSKSSLGTNRTGDDDAPAEAHTWEELAEYERGEVILRLLRRITGTCLRNDRLRVLEREEWVCSGTSSDDALTCTQHLLLFGHVRHRHREALLALIRQMRLHAVRDLDTSVTIGLQPGDAVPYVLLEPLSPSPQTDGYIRWNRVYCAMRCGILQKLRAREEKIRHRLRELVQETDATSSKLPFAAAAAHSSLSAGEGGSVSTPAETLRFYTEEFGQLFTMDDPPGADGASGNGARSPVDANHKRAKQFLPVSEFMAATKASQVSLVQLAASVPTVLVAWSARYPECVAWLRRELFDDTHLKEIRSATGLSGRFAVLMDKDPWVSFAESHGGILPRLPTLRAGFRIELLQPLPKRAQIVLLNMDKDTEVARTTLEKLRRRLSGWVSPEVDLLSLWSGPKGLQSELATLFNVQTLPFVVLTRPGQLPPHATIGSKSSTPHTTANTDPARTSPVPVIVDVSCDPVQVSKRLYGVPDTPRSSGAAADNTWHRLAPAERARIVQRCGAYLVQQRLPLYFTATVTRDYVLRDSTATDPWQAVRDTASSHVCVLGEVITTHDIQPILAELRALAKLRDFEWGVRLIERSAPLLSSVDMTTPQRLLKGEMRCVTCSNCLTRLFVDTEAHVRCLCCSSTNSNDGAFCEKCAFTLRCHTPHHFLLRIPADYHYGVYCDRCRGMIRGTRWKCAVCYQYDLCDACARARRAAVPAIANGDRGTEAPPAPSPVTERKIDGDAVPAQHDDATHPMIYIPFAQGSQHDKFLKQACVGSLQEWLDSVHR